MRPPTLNSGFTLIEMMVVVAIIAVIASIMIGVNSQTYGVGAQNTSDELVSAFNLCKMRAVSTRRWHRCEVTPTTLTVMQWQTTGMVVPAAGTWSVVEVVTIGNGVAMWDASATPCATSPCAGAPSTANAGLHVRHRFQTRRFEHGWHRVRDRLAAMAKQYRVVVYKATGSSYARNSW